MLDLMAILTDKVEEWVHLPDSSMPDFTDRFSLSLADEQLEQLASDVRRAFGLGNGPISNVGALIENAGVIFSALPLPNGMDGQSTWQGGRAFVAIGADGTRARCRMDLAHEIGHLVLHKLVADEEMDDETYSTLEKQAWYFAGAFLMPAETFLREVYQTSLEGLLQLKPRWGVSLAAMIRRLKNLGVINESRYKSLQIELRARGWHKIEPQDEAQRERSRLLKGAVDFLCENGRIGLSDFAAGTSLPIWFLASALEASSAELVSVPTTNVVEFKPRQKPA
jgi:Zn-dependent peptidase ImmA (M78 family)